MQIEECIKILEDDVEQHECHGGRGILDDAIRFAVAALRAQQARLDRSQWECEVCCSESCEICRYDGDFDSCTSCFRNICDEFEPLKFCPNCGRPLT